MNATIQDTLLDLFHQVIKDPDRIPAMPIDTWQEGSQEQHLLTSFRDMLECMQQSQRQAEAQLREREGQYRSIFEASTDALLIIDFAEQAITVPGPETACIAAACRAHHMTVAIGVTERPARAGTLYNTLLYFGPDGMILGRHRKLMPTFNERMVWGMGDGTTLRTIETPQAVVGGLICWENFMPLARTVLYTQGEQVHVAPTLNPGSERWLSAMRQIANEGRMWVISVGCLLRESDLPAEVTALGLFEKGVVLNAYGKTMGAKNYATAALRFHSHTQQNTFYAF